tara:strand:- start:441 stop:1193 length:753 start_codon:yes stop_codon:yes gene_type:complete
MNSITEQFATFNISGPKSRVIMSRVFSDIDFSSDNFPFMTFKNFNYLDTQIRILRASFTGELGYEIYVPPKYALKLWQKFFFYSRDFDLVPYGTETMHLLRAEKGYIIVGQDTDGTVTPLDLNLNWMIGKKKKDFIGKRSLSRSDIVRENRKQLVGLIPLDKTYGIEEGQHVIEKENLSIPIKKPIEMLGHVTSSYFSPTLKHSVAMALIKGGKKKVGSKLYVSTSDLNVIPVEVVETSFIDPKNERMML